MRHCRRPAWRRTPRATEPVDRTGRPLVGAAKAGELTPRQPGSGTVVLDSVGALSPASPASASARRVCSCIAQVPATTPPSPRRSTTSAAGCRAAPLVADVANQRGYPTSKPAITDRPPVGRPPPPGALGRVLAGPGAACAAQVVPDEAVRLGTKRREYAAFTAPFSSRPASRPARAQRRRRQRSSSPRRSRRSSAAPAQMGRCFSFRRPLVGRNCAFKAVAELTGRCEVLVLHPGEQRRRLMSDVQLPEGILLLDLVTAVPQGTHEPDPRPAWPAARAPVIVEQSSRASGNYDIVEVRPIVYGRARHRDRGGIHGRGPRRHFRGLRFTYASNRVAPAGGQNLEPEPVTWQVTLYLERAHPDARYRSQRAQTTDARRPASPTPTATGSHLGERSLADRERQRIGRGPVCRRSRPVSSPTPRPG